MAQEPYDQAHRAFDDSPRRFRDAHPDVAFAGASGVLFEQAMAQTRMAICLCDPKQDDLPIVFANRSFCELTGYPEDEVIGRNCRFLQGEETDPEAVARIRTAIANEDVVVVELLNYRKDGEAFWNALHLGPVYGEDGELLYLFGSQWDVSEVRAARAEESHAREMARELSHRMKNMFAVIGGIVSVTGRARGIEPQAREINERIQALGRAYDTTLDDAAKGSVEVGKSIRAVLAPYNHGGQIALKGNGLRSDFGSISALGLSLHELAINALKHGALKQDGGRIEVDWRAIENGGRPMMEISWDERGGPAVEAAPPGDAKGMGSGIVDRIVAMSGGKIDRDWRREGLAVTIRLPRGE